MRLRFGTRHAHAVVLLLLAVTLLAVLSRTRIGGYSPGRETNAIGAQNPASLPSHNQRTLGRTGGEAWKAATPPTTAATSPWHDAWGDGFPEAARLDRFEDRQNFVRWLTFLAESQFYGQNALAREEVQDCAALIRFAFRHALVAHSTAWRRTVDLPCAPGFGNILKFSYPNWPLGRGLFRTQPGPFSPIDLDRGVFAEFADAETLLRYNSFRVSSNLRAARPGDLLFFHQPAQRQPYHVMLFVGHSHFQPQGSDWIVYHTGELNGGRGEIREVEASLLQRHPDPRWRPLETNPHFLGVYRFALLRQ